ncbi:MAG: hypothetical protein U0X76_08185 [Bacteroidia bacterium]
MKKFLLLLMFVVLNFCLFAQNISWLQSDSISLIANPQIAAHKLAVSTTGAIAAKEISINQIYSSDGFGDYIVDNVDTGGSLLNRIHVDGKLVVTGLATDQAGNIFIGGKFMDKLYINGVDSLVNTGGGFDRNFFLMSFTSQGVLRWKRNLSLTNSDIYDITTMERDANGAIWYVWQQSTASHCSA